MSMNIKKSSLNKWIVHIIWIVILFISFLIFNSVCQMNKYQRDVDEAIKLLAQKDPNFKVAIIPPYGRFDKKISDICKKDNISFIKLTYDEFLNPDVFNANNFPMAIYPGNNILVTSYKSPDDYKNALKRYLTQKGFLCLIAYGGPPLSQNRNASENWFWTGDNLSFIRDELRLGIYTPEESNGLSDDIKKSFNKVPEPYMFFTVNESQDFVYSGGFWGGDIPKNIPFHYESIATEPYWGNYGFFPLNSNLLQKGDIITPIIELTGDQFAWKNAKDKQVNNYGIAMGLVNYGSGDFKGSSILYIWGHILDNPNADYSDRIIESILLSSIRRHK